MNRTEMDPPETLGALLRRAASFPQAGLRLLDRREREQWCPWPEIDQRARRVAGDLRELGIQPGERVVLIYPTGVGFFDAFFGILLAGAVPVPLYPPVRLGRLDEYHRRTSTMIRAVEARLILTEPRLRRWLGATIEASSLSLGCLSLADLPEGEPCHRTRAATDLALVQFSSGTTVDPKPVALSHRAILAQVRALNGCWPEGQSETEDSGVSWLPLYHDMGLIGCVLPALERPGILTLIGPEVFVARPSIWLRAISKYRATISVAPNFAYGLCVDKIKDHELEGVDLSCWRVALNGAEAVAPSVLFAFQDRFASRGFRPEAMTPVYGLSEASLAVTFSSLDRAFRTERFDRQALAEHGEAKAADSDAESGVERVSVGRPLPGFELRIIDRTGRDLPENREGRVLVRGPSLMDGYLGRPEATRKAIQDGWLDTGDLGFLYEGELFLTGRAKDVIILRGRNHAPADIEQQLDAVPGVRKGCAVAVSHLPEGATGEVLLIFVETARDASEEQLAALETACVNAILGGLGLKPDRIVVLSPGTLPRTSSGKLRRQETLTRHLADQLTATAKVTPIYLTRQLARSTLARAGARRQR